MLSGALPSILNYYDRQFYGCQLIPTICGETSRENNELKDINKIFPKPDNGATKKPFGLCFVNVEGRNERKENKKSWENKEEATIVSATFDLLVISLIISICLKHLLLHIM